METKKRIKERIKEVIVNGELNRKKAIQNLLNSIASFIAEGYSLGVNPLPLLRKKWGGGFEYIPSWLLEEDIRKFLLEERKSKDGFFVFAYTDDSLYNDGNHYWRESSTTLRVALKIGEEVYLSNDYTSSPVVTEEWWEDEE